MKKKTKKKLKNWGKMKKKTQECLNNIRIRFPTYENECYDKRTRILRTMIVTFSNVNACMVRTVHTTLPTMDGF